LASLDRYEESLTLYDRLVEYRPDNEGISLGRAELLLRMDRIDESVAQYRKAIKRWPDSALSLNALGYTLADHTAEYKEAEKLIRKALKYDPESPAIIDSLGWVLHKQGQHEAALVELKKAYAKLDDPEVASHIIEVLASLDRSDEALEMLVAAEEKAPSSPQLKDVRERLFADAD
jgi:tetratricopeptide (TPR) repeat protein